MAAGEDGLARARRDLEAGRLWKARDRLQGVVGARPADQQAIGLLAEVYLRMGDLPEAGRWLVLTEREDAAARAAIAALGERYTFAQMLRELPVRSPFDSYPPVVAARLRELERRAREEGIEFAPRTPRRSHSSGRWLDDVTDAPGNAMQDYVLITGCLLAFLGPWILGVVFAVVLVLRLA